MPIGERLKYARERAALTGLQVHERTGIGESSLSEFENGKREPSLGQLRLLAHAYRRSVSFFLAEGAIPSEVVFWRKRPQPGAEEIEVEFLRLCENYHNLEVWTGEKPIVGLPQAEGNRDTFSYPQAEELAKTFRRELQLGDHPAHALLKVLEEVCAVKVFHLTFEPSGTAASTFSDTFGPAILMNSGNRRWRRNHDLAHELFHLLTWKLFRGTTQRTQATEATDREESLATCFARHLLMPTEPLRTAINSRQKNGKVRFEDLYDVAREFDVSVESLLWHMHLVYGHSSSESEKTRQAIERAKALVPALEDRSEDLPPCWPARYEALAVKALRRGEISIGRFADYLGISRQQAMKYVEQEAAGNEEIQVAPA
jgi:Zn-dependent peptidase ImmA (M78 family)/DNA-binding XRE family transcriptional regulator